MVNNHSFDQEIKRVYDALLARYNPTSPDSLVSAIEAMLPDQDSGQIREYVARIDSGLEWGKKLAASPAFQNPRSAEQMLDDLTRNLSPQEKKGLYLILYESFRESDAVQFPSASAACHDYEVFPRYTAEELKKVVCAQLEYHAQDIAASLKDNLADPPLFSEAPPDARVLCAAYYVAGTTGDIPQCFAQIPELSAICCEVGQSASHRTPEENAALLHIIIAGIIAVMVVVSATTGFMPEVCAYLLTILEKSTFHSTVKLILSSLIKNSLTQLTSMLLGTLTFVSVRNKLDKAYAAISAPVEEPLPAAVQTADQSLPITPEIFA